MSLKNYQNNKIKKKTVILYKNILKFYKNPLILR